MDIAEIVKILYEVHFFFQTLYPFNCLLVYCNALILCQRLPGAVSQYNILFYHYIQGELMFIIEHAFVHYGT